MVSANKDNPPRKSFQEVLEAFAKFLPKAKGKASLYFHTNTKQPGGFNITNYAKHLGIQKHIFSLHPYEVNVKATHKDLAEVISSFDALLMPSTNEGFGIPTIEAQACEVPVVVNNHTSMPEMVKHEETGFIVEPDHYRWSNIQAKIAIPSVKGLEEVMNTLYKLKKDGRLSKIGKKAREHVIEKYDHDMLVKTKWIPLFDKISKDITNDQRT